MVDILSKPNLPSGLFKANGIDYLLPPSQQAGPLIDDGAGHPVWGVSPYENAVDNGDLGRWRSVTTITGIAFGQAGSGAYNWSVRNDSNVGVVRIDRDTDVPTYAQAGANLLYSHKVTVTTIDATIGASDLLRIINTIAGYDIRSLANGFSYSFWVNNHLTGTYCLVFWNNTSGANGRYFLLEYTVSAADTWQYVSGTVTALPTSGTWDYVDTNAGLGVYFGLAVGSNYQGSASAAWQTGGPIMGTSSQANFLSSTTNIVKFAGLNVIPGPVALPCRPANYAGKAGISDHIPPAGEAYGIGTDPGIGPGYAYWDHVHGLSAITLADLPTITQRANVLAATGGPTTTSATPVSLVDPVVTMTTLASGECLFWWNGGFSSSIAGTAVSVQLDVDGVQVGVVCSVTCRTAFDVYQFQGQGRVTGLSAASHTFQLYWFVSGGATATANGTNRSLTVLEVRK